MQVLVIWYFLVLGRTQIVARFYNIALNMFSEGKMLNNININSQN